MKYMMMFYETQEAFTARDDPEKAGPYWGAWTSYVGALQQAGVTIHGQGLQPPSTATTLRSANGKRAVQDGPMADTKEQLAGFFVIDVPDLDSALEWAARSPATAGVELRPVLPPPPTQ